MNQTFAEILLFASVAMNAAVLTFMAGVLRKVTNDMDGPAFRHYLGSLYRHSVRSAFMLTLLGVPFVGAIPYFYFYGFGNRWIVAGLALWLAAGCIAKVIKVPIFNEVASLEGEDAAGLGWARVRLNAGNLFQAVLNVVAAVLMAVSFIRR